MFQPMRYEQKPNSNEVIMPTKVVLTTLAIYTAILLMSEMSLFLWHFSAGTALSAAQINITAMIASSAALPAIGFFVYKSEDTKADLRHLEQISRIDTLTGVLNRRSFDEQANGYIARARSDESAGTYLFIDVDKFKAINDQLGHAAGDKVLAIIGASLIAGTHPNDLVGRIGGDEFGVFLPHAAIDDGVKVAELLRRKISRNYYMFNLDGLDISVSIGIAEHRPGTSLQECIRAADRQLYAAKDGGRDQVCVDQISNAA